MLPAFEWIDISAIVFSEDLQARVSVSEAAERDYFELASNSLAGLWPFKDPVEIFECDGVMYLTDGWQRCHSMVKAGKTEVYARVVRGSCKDDVVAAVCIANAKHGLRRTNDDKRRAVKIALEQWPEATAASIAEKCGVSWPLANSVKKEMFPEQSRESAPEEISVPDLGVSQPEIEGQEDDQETPDHTRGRSAGVKCQECEVDWWKTDEKGRDFCGNCGVKSPAPATVSSPGGDDSGDDDESAIASDDAKKLSSAFGSLVRAIERAGLMEEFSKWLDPMGKRIGKICKT